MARKKALVLGGSGLIGSYLIHQLLEHQAYEQIRSIGRKSLAITHPQFQEKTIRLHQLEQENDFFRVDEVYCCLGTTMKKAKTKDHFRQVDFVYPIQAAKLAASVGAKQFLIVTSLGANKKSPFFYLRVKGEVEEALHNISIPSIHIFQPSFLLGNRKEFRLNEKIFSFLEKPLTRLMMGSLAVYRPIHASTVAKAMITIATQDIKGYHTYPSYKIKKIAIARPSKKRS